MNWLLELTLRGALASLLFAGVDACTARWVPPRLRRWGWVALVLLWLAPWQRPFLRQLPQADFSFAPSELFFLAPPAPSSLPGHLSPPALQEQFSLWPRLWLAGVAASLALLLWRTWRTHRAWRQHRLCTDSTLLSLLEDCRRRADVHAPIALVLSSQLSSPALLGWLRPRILLPERLARECPAAELRGIFFHELAHFRAADVPLQWLLSLAQALHWFNPCIHLVATRWRVVRELAADAQALAWLNPPDHPAYADALLRAVKTPPLSLPSGALALGESFQQIRTRLLMITRPLTLTRRAWSAFALALALLAASSLPLTAEAPAPARTSSEQAQASLAAWLKVTDAGDYAASHATAGQRFREATSAEQWASACGHVHRQVGSLVERTFLRAQYLTAIPDGTGGKINGEFVIIQYDSKFTQFEKGRETVTAEKEKDGVWRCVGYFVAPR